MPRASRAASPEQWALLGAAMNARRRALGYLTIREAVDSIQGDGIGDQLWGKVEAGDPANGKVSIAALDAICRALRWESGSADQVLDGGEPTDIPNGMVEIKAAAAKAEAALRELRRLLDSA